MAKLAIIKDDGTIYHEWTQKEIMCDLIHDDSAEEFLGADIRDHFHCLDMDIEGRSLDNSEWKTIWEERLAEKG